MNGRSAERPHSSSAWCAAFGWLARSRTRRAAGRRSLDWYYDEDGCLVIRGRFDPEDGAVVVRALRDAMDHTEREERVAGAPGPHGVSAKGNAASGDVPAETPAGDVPAATPAGDVPAEASPEDATSDPFASAPFQRRAADALVAMAEDYLTGPRGPGRARNLVVLHVDARTLAGDEGKTGRLESGARVVPEVARRLACDAELVRVLSRDAGPPQTIGRRSRVVPRRMRRALDSRDGGCRFPACHARARVDAHHVIHWAAGGHTSLDNLMLLCRRHHRFVHEFGFRVRSGTDGGFVFERPDGTPIKDGSPSSGTARDLIDFNEQRGLVIDPSTTAPQWDGRHPDYGLAVEVFLASDIWAGPADSSD